MARQSQKERINLLAEALAELTDRFICFLTNQTGDEVDFVEQLRELRSVCVTCADQDSFLKMQEHVTNATSTTGTVLPEMGQ